MVAVMLRQAQVLRNAKMCPMTHQGSIAFEWVETSSKTCKYSGDCI